MKKFINGFIAAVKCVFGYFKNLVIMGVFIVLSVISISVRVVLTVFKIFLYFVCGITNLQNLNPDTMKYLAFAAKINLLAELFSGTFFEKGIRYFQRLALNAWLSRGGAK